MSASRPILVLNVPAHGHINPTLPVLLGIARRRRGLVARFGPEVFPRKSIAPCLGDANIVYTSRAFQPDTTFVDDTFRFVGPSIRPATKIRANDSHGLDIDPDRPCVYLSLGTIYHRATNFFRTAFEAFAGHSAQFVASAGDEANLRDLPPAPANFIVRPYLPQVDILRRADAFVTHGGMNSISEGLYFEVPLVVVPQQIEQALNGRRVAEVGAGILLGDRPPYGRVDAERLRTAVDGVLGQPEYAARARQVGESFRLSGGYAEAASLIEARLS